MNSLKSDQINSSVEHATTYAELGYRNMEDMINHGWKVIAQDDDSNSLQGETPINGGSWVKAAGAATSETRELTTSLLKDLGIDNPIPNYKRNGKVPDGMSISSTEFYGNGVTHNLSKLMNLHAYLEIVTPEAVSESIITNPDYVYGTTEYNFSDEESKRRVSLAVKMGTRKTWSQQVSGSLRVGASTKIKVPLVAEAQISVEVMVGGAVTNGTDVSEEVTYRSAPSVTLPPHSKKTIAIAFKNESMEASYRINYRFIGDIGVNYASPQDGHYFWAMPASKLGDLTSETGKITIARKYNATVIESPATPL